MKRDWDQIRRILIAIEESPGGEIRAGDFTSDPEEEINYQMNLMIEAGIVEGKCITTRSSVRSCRIERMTWSGHELLDSIRAQSVWSRIKQAAIDKGASLTLDLILTLGKEVLK